LPASKTCTIADIANLPNHCGRAFTIGVQKPSAMVGGIYFLVLFLLTFGAQRVEPRLARAD
jgi:hypothetical protein